MVKIVGIQFQNNGKIHYFDADNLMMKPGDYVVADTAKGLDLGEDVIGKERCRGYEGERRAT